jgi:O-antigen/teichoic acid export membrane protein
MKTLARQSLWLFLARLGTQAGMALFTILLARRLGSAGFGEYAFMAALVVIGNIVTTYGTDMFLIREIAARDDLTQLPAALALQLTLSTPFVAAIFLLSPRFPSFDADGIAALRVYSLSLFALAFFTVFTTALRGKRQMEAYALLNFLLAVMQVAVAAFLFFSRSSLVTLAWLLLLVQILAALFAGMLCVTKIPGFWRGWKFSINGMFRLISASGQVALLSVLGVLYQRLSLMLLPFLAGPAQTGIFSAAARTVEMVKLGHIAVFTAIYPLMAESKARGAERLRSFRAQGMILLAAAVLLALALSLLAAPLVRSLFGVGYAASVPVMQILAWTLVPYTLNTFLSLAFLTDGRESILAGALTASLIGLAVTLVWWERAAGVNGAAWAVLFAETLQSAILLLQVLNRRETLSPLPGGTHEFPELS